MDCAGHPVLCRPIQGGCWASYQDDFSSAHSTGKWNTQLRENSRPQTAHGSGGGFAFLINLPRHSHQRCNGNCSSCLSLAPFLCRWKHRSRIRSWWSCRPSALSCSNIPQGTDALPKTAVPGHCQEASMLAPCLHTQFPPGVLDTAPSLYTWKSSLARPPLVGRELPGFPLLSAFPGSSEC